MSSKIVLAADPFGFPLKQAIKEHLLSEGYEVLDLGTDSPDHFIDYYEVGSKAAKAIQNRSDRPGDYLLRQRDGGFSDCE